MKRIVRCVVIVLVTVVISNRSFSQTGWTWQNPLPQGNTLYGIHMIDINNVVAVGEVGTIVRTADGGTNWSVQSYTGGNSNTLYGVSFADSLNGIAVGEGGIILRTTDGGLTWAQQTSGLTSDLNAVAYINADIATVVGNQSVILRTTNGGIDWNPQIPSGQWDLNSVSFIHPDTGMVSGGFDKIYQTVDGGLNWIEQTVTFSTMLNGVSMMNSNVAVAVGGGGAIFRTINGGTDWSLQTITGNQLHAVSMTNSGTGFAVGSNGTIVQTIDSGVSWRSQVSGTSRELYDVSVLNPRIVMGVSANGTVIYTENSGSFWSMLSSGTILGLDGISFAGDTVGTAVGETGTILRTINGGESWVPQASNTTNDLYDVSMVDRSNAYAVGLAGTIRRTVDGGTNWSAIVSGTVSNLYGVSFISATIGTVVGSNGTIRRTTTGGLGWINQSTGIVTYQDVHFTDANTGTVVGNDGTILRTTNGGAAWIPQTSNTVSHLYSVHFINSLVGTVVGSYGIILRTTNGGTTWFSQSSDLNYDLIGVSFSDINNGIAVGNSGIILRTTNGGTTWTRQFSGTLYTLKDVYTRDANNVVVAGANGTILRTTSSGLTPNSISGIKFHDIDADGIRDSNEAGLSGWIIELRNATSNTLITTTTTDFAGNYLFSELIDGKFRVSEIEQSNYIRTYPSFPGYQDVELIGGTPLIEINFGNKLANRSRVSGLWSSISTWSFGHLPRSDDAVEISTNVIVDALPEEAILGLKLNSGGVLTFNSGVGPLKIQSHVQIGNGGKLEFPNPGATGIVCFADWENHGDFIAGNSTITMAGDRAKAIDVTAFFNLVIDGDNTSTFDNIIIQNQLTLRKPLYARSQDTIFIQNSAPNSIVDTGRIPQGTIQRQIQTGSIENYRFESPQSYIRFDGSGIYPSSISISAMPNVTIDSTLQWLVLNSTVNTDSNFVKVDSLSDFSKFVLGKPNVGSIGSSVVNRQYTIKQTSGSNFKARLQLRYEQSEVPPSEDESTLRLLRGPILMDSVSGTWNMLSVPVQVSDYRKVKLFPDAVSSAFAYKGGYVAKDTLSNGVGYWLKYPTDTLIYIVGDERMKDTVDVNDKWNLIGTLTFPVDAASVTSIPTGIIATSFFGYNPTSGYFTADSLMPFRGYWLKVNAAGQLIFDLTTFHHVDKGISISGIINELNTLMFRDSLGSERRLYFTNSKIDDLDINYFELPPTPPHRLFDIRYESGRLVEVADPQISKEVPILISSASYPVNIKWKVNAKHPITSLLVGKIMIPLVDSGKTTISNAQTMIALRFSPQKFREIPKEFHLYQNYPNPFNPTTTIRFDLPFDALVTLTVFNILGQEIAVIAQDKTYEAGYYREDFNSTDFPSGVYIYQLVAKNISASLKQTIFQSRKMLHIR